MPIDRHRRAGTTHCWPRQWLITKMELMIDANRRVYVSDGTTPERDHQEPAASAGAR